MRFIRGAALAVVMLGAPSMSAGAQLPSVQEVYDHYATAVGGRDAWSKVAYRSEKGTANIAFANLSGSYERYYATPNKMRLIIDIGIGRIQQGNDGVVAWAAQPDGSVAKMPEPEAAYSIEAATVGAAFLDPSLFTKAAVLAQETFDGVPCYKVAVTTRAGRERIDYFEVTSGLRRGQVVQTPAGEQKTVFKDFKPFDGKLVSTTQVLTNAQGDIIITIASVTFEPNDPKLFERPAGLPDVQH
jgi:hypothetical protein